MKKVHWKTRQAIIREHEKNTRIVVASRGLKIIDMSLRDLNLVAGFRAGSTIFQIDLESFRPFRP